MAHSTTLGGGVSFINSTEQMNQEINVGMSADGQSFLVTFYLSCFLSVYIYIYTQKFKGLDSDLKLSLL